MGRAPALILALVPALQSAPPPAATVDADPAPRRAIAGIRSLEIASTIVYAALPDAPHRLQATYAFPDRARWWLGVGAEPSTRRQMRFRLGSACWALDPDVGASRALSGVERDTTLVQLEMRRALFLWPHGFEWKRSGEHAETRVADLGSITATFADAKAKNPSGLSFVASDGQAGDEYRAITWKIAREKSWPARVELWHEQALVWTETVDAVDTSTRYIDSYFLPPDKRDKTGAKPVEVGVVRALDLPEHRSLRVALEKGASWDDARAAHARMAAEHAAALWKLGLALEDHATFEVSVELEPVAVLLRLARAREPLDPSIAKTWALIPERPGLSTFVVGLTTLVPARLAAVRAAAPADAQCGTPYVRFDPAHPEQFVMVLQPLVPRADVPAEKR